MDRRLQGERSFFINLIADHYLEFKNKFKGKNELVEELYQANSLEEMISMYDNYTQVKIYTPRENIASKRVVKPETRRTLSEALEFMEGVAADERLRNTEFFKRQVGERREVLARNGREGEGFFIFFPTGGNKGDPGDRGGNGR